MRRRNWRGRERRSASGVPSSWGSWQSQPARSRRPPPPSRPHPAAAAGAVAGMNGVSHPSSPDSVIPSTVEDSPNHAPTPTPAPDASASPEEDEPLLVDILMPEEEGEAGGAPEVHQGEGGDGGGLDEEPLLVDLVTPLEGRRKRRRRRERRGVERRVRGGRRRLQARMRMRMQLRLRLGQWLRQWLSQWRWAPLRLAQWRWGAPRCCRAAPRGVARSRSATSPRVPRGRRHHLQCLLRRGLPQQRALLRRGQGPRTRTRGWGKGGSWGGGHTGPRGWVRGGSGQECFRCTLGDTGRGAPEAS